MTKQGELISLTIDGTKFDSPEVITNGVDVVPCQYWVKGICSCIDVRDCEGYIDILITDCEDNPNCYFKQRQRTERVLNRAIENRRELLKALDMEALMVKKLNAELSKYKKEGNRNGKSNT